MKQTTIKLSDDVHEQLKIMAAKRRSSMNTVMVEAIDRFLQSERQRFEEEFEVLPEELSQD